MRSDERLPLGAMSSWTFPVKDHHVRKWTFCGVYFALLLDNLLLTAVGKENISIPVFKPFQLSMAIKIPMTLTWNEKTSIVVFALN